MSHSPSRRDLLAAFLGTPVALAGCSSRRPSLRFDGKIVGASDGMGHRLRDGLQPSPEEDRWQRVRVVIVGGGVAGLAAAWQLLRSGCNDFVLLELEA